MTSEKGSSVEIGAIPYSPPSSDGTGTSVVSVPLREDFPISSSRIDVEDSDGNRLADSDSSTGDDIVVEVADIELWEVLREASEDVSASESDTERDEAALWRRGGAMAVNRLLATMCLPTTTNECGSDKG